MPRIKALDDEVAEMARNVRRSPRLATIPGARLARLATYERHARKAAALSSRNDPSHAPAPRLNVLTASRNFPELKRAALSATAVNVVLNICFSRSATLVWSGSTSTMFLTSSS